MRLSGVIYADQGRAIVTLVGELERQIDRRTALALGDDPASRRQNRREARRELPAKAGRVAVWRVEEDKIVLTAGDPCALEERKRSLPVHVRCETESLEVVPDGEDSGRRGVDELR